MSTPITGATTLDQLALELVSLGALLSSVVLVPSGWSVLIRSMESPLVGFGGGETIATAIDKALFDYRQKAAAKSVAGSPSVAVGTNT